MTPEPSAYALVFALIGGVATWAVIIAVVMA
jgi:hypothetical protein